MTHFADDEVKAYAASRKLVPGTLLWATDVPLTEDAFRSGGKNAAGVDFLRFTDIMSAPIRDGRVPAEESGDFMVNPGHGISLFIKQMLSEGLIHLGTQGTPGTPPKAELKKQYDPFKEKYWWKIEKGQTLPPGLQLVYDGEPPGHCTLTVESPKTVQAFLALVALVHFESLGTDYYGKLK
jgi:hypothetical protein